MSKDIEKGTTSINIQLSIHSPKGFVLPADCHWDPAVGNKVKDGKVQVLTNDGMLFAQLSFKNDKLDGDCLFYDEGQVCEKVHYKKDVKHGWCTSFQNGTEAVSYFFEDGVQKKKLVKWEAEDMWKEVDIKNELNYEICKLDKEFKRQGPCQKFVGGVLAEESLYKDGECVQKCKEFQDKEMTEFNENGMKVYQGEYSNVFLKGNVRNGKGKEFVDGVVSYVGEWKRGEKEGEGKSMKNSRAYYVGHWKEGLPDGKGKLLNEDGSVFVEGEWKRGVVKKGWKNYDYGSGKMVCALPVWLCYFVQIVFIVVQVILGCTYEDCYYDYYFCGGFMIWSFITLGIYGVYLIVSVLKECTSCRISDSFLFGYSTVGVIASIAFNFLCAFQKYSYDDKSYLLTILSPVLFFVFSFHIFKQNNPSFQFKVPSKWYYGSVCITVIHIILFYFDLFEPLFGLTWDDRVFYACAISIDLVVLILQTIPKNSVAKTAVIIAIIGNILLILCTIPYFQDMYLWLYTLCLLFAIFSYLSFKKQKSLALSK